MKRRPLVIPLAALRQGENRYRFELSADELGLANREVCENPSFEQLQGPVVVELLITRTGVKFLLQGKVDFRACLHCALCDAEFEQAFSEPLNAQLIEGGEADDRDTGPAESVTTRIDLVPLVHDSIHLAVPIAPLCRPDCRGLCVNCGASLNQGPCNCGS